MLRLLSGGILHPHTQRGEKKEILVLIGRWIDRYWIVRNMANVSSPGELKYCHLSDFFVAFTTIFRTEKKVLCCSNAIRAPTSLDHLGGHLQAVLFYTNNCLLLSDCICFVGLHNNWPQTMAEKTEVCRFWRSEAWNHGVVRVGSFCGLRENLFCASLLVSGFPQPLVFLDW